MKKIKSIAIGLTLFSFSTYAQLPEGEFTYLKSVKVTKDAQKINRENIPKATEWCAEVDKKIDANDCEGLLNVQWDYDYKEVVSVGSSGMFHVTTGSLTPVRYDALGGSEELGQDYWFKIGKALAECGYLDEIMAEDYKVVFNRSDKYKILDEMDADWKMKKGNGISVGLIDYLNKSDVTNELKRLYAWRILYYLKDNERYSDTKLIDAIFPYYEEHFHWIFFLGSANYAPAIPKIVAALQSTNLDARTDAVWSLGNMKVKSALAKLEIIAENDSYYYIDDYGYKVYDVRDKAKEAIQKIKLAE